MAAMCTFHCPEHKCEKVFNLNTEYRAHWIETHKFLKKQRVPHSIVRAPSLAQVTRAEELAQFRFEENSAGLLTDEKTAKVICEQKAKAAVTNKTPETIITDNGRTRNKRRKLHHFKIDHELHVEKIRAIQDVSLEVQDTMHAINNIDCDENVKDILRHMTLRAVDEKAVVTDRKPAVVISNLVQEHLGYTPAKVNGGTAPVKDLYIEIGRQSRQQYLRLYGKSPPKRIIQSVNGGPVQETNEYSSGDRGWILGIVRDICHKFKVHPRPKVAMARGEEIIPFE